MHLFKFTHPTKTNLTHGEAINGYSSAMWIERYRDAGEFEIEANLSSGLLDFLPQGTLISHVDTLDVCIVEDHEINDEVDEEPVVKITGRSLDAWLENRIVGINYAYGTPAAPFTEYVLSAAVTWSQIVTLINAHIKDDQVANANDSLDDTILAFTDILGSGVAEDRTIKRGNLHERVLELLSVDDLGLRVIRKHPSHALASPTTTRLYVHQGVDRSNSVLFSANAGDIDSAQYLWSLRKKKNAALVQGRYVETVVTSTEAGYDRRWMFVDASDIDGSLTTAPTGGTLTSIRTKMQRRGRDALRKQTDVNIAQVDISRNIQVQYRKDYDIGDIVTVDGKYGISEKRRVVEYVEIEDQNGVSGHPTLARLGE